jgi:hypothetical protein
MSESSLNQIEHTFSQLSVSEQLRLIERLVHHMNEATKDNTNDLDEQLALMAADPDIQRELREIEREFSQAEADGLEIA